MFDQRDYSIHKHSGIGPIISVHIYLETKNITTTRMVRTTLPAKPPQVTPAIKPTATVIENSQ